MAVRLTTFQNWLIRSSVIFWLLGLLLPHLYLLFLASLVKIKKQLLESNLFRYLAIFFIIQIISLSLSLLYPFFTWGRFIAALHNITVYLFIFAGINIALTNGIDQTSRLATSVFKWIIWLIVISSILSIILKIPFSYPGILSIFGENKYTFVNINGLKWYMVSNFPRSSVYGIYPNSTGLVLIILYPLYKIRNLKFSFADGLFIFASFMTGSRMFFVVSVALVLISLIKNKNVYLYGIILFPIIIAIVFPFIVTLYHMKEGSNAMRMILYKESIDLMMATNPILGIGIKPNIGELTLGANLPLGSHSTLIGYFFKTGLLGGEFSFCSGICMYLSGI